MSQAGSTSGGSDSPRRDRQRTLPVPPALGCAFSVLLGLAGVAITFVVLSLAFRGELRLTGEQLTERRIWLIREQGEFGLGLSNTRVVNGSEDSGQACVATKVRFLMLRSEQPVLPADYCECYQQMDGSWQSIGECEE